MGRKGKRRSLAGASLARKLGTFVSMTVISSVFALLAIFCWVTYGVQMDERQSNLQAIAATVAKLIERPVSLGDYALVEAYLSGQELPPFIQSLAVTDADGTLLAGQNFRNERATECRFSKTVRLPIGKGSILMPNQSRIPHLIMDAGFCDIRSNAITFGIGALSVGVFLLLIIGTLSRSAVKRTLRPLLAAVDAGVSPTGLGRQVIDTAPEEIRPLLLRIDGLYTEFLRVEASAKVGELAAQVAHDVRSPLTALRSIANNATGMPAEQGSLLISVIDRITDIANGLLQTQRRAFHICAASRHEPMNSRQSSGPFLITDVVESLISEKREQYRMRSEINVVFEADATAFGLFTSANRGELTAVLSNLIDNGVEAIEVDGEVKVGMRRHEGNIEITINDTGRGISEADLGKLGTKGFTHGKKDGSGLGLYHAKRYIDAAQGALTITSKPGKGTLVRILLPYEPPPIWCATEVVFSKQGDIVVVDDDPSIGATWRDRLGQSGLVAGKVKHVAHQDDLTKLISSLESPENAIFLVDLDLGVGKPDGLSLVDDMPTAASKLLITSHYDNEGVRKRAREQGLKILPKPMLPYVPLRIRDEAWDCVLVDDDPIIQTAWAVSARVTGKRLKIFSAAPLWDELQEVSADTLFYVDQNIGPGISGIDVAKQLAAWGFRNLVLATGMEKFREKDVPWVCRITTDKGPPWEVGDNFG